MKISGGHMNEAALNLAAEALCGRRKWKHLNKYQRESMRVNAARIIRVYENEIIRQDNLAEDDTLLPKGI